MIDDHKCQQSLDKKGLIYDLDDHLASHFSPQVQIENIAFR